jgi:hypothetical protein
MVAMIVPWRDRHRRFLPLKAVVRFAAVGTKFGWYGLATGTNPWRVRTAYYVALVGLAVTLLAAQQRISCLMWPFPVIAGPRRATAEGRRS